MGETSQLAVKSAAASITAAETSQTGLVKASENASLAAKTHERLANITERLETRDARSKWDWVTLAVGMEIAAILAGTEAIYFTKQNLDTANFKDAISLIANDTRN